MDHRRKLQSGQERASRFSVHPKIFVFFDKSTGTRLFEVTAREDGRMPQEQAVSLLAMHCVARQQMPKDFGVMVATGEDLVENLAGRAMELIRTCSARPDPSSPDSSLALTQRQNEVLACIAQNHVCRRVDLILEAFRLPATVHKREAYKQCFSREPSRNTNENDRQHVMMRNWRRSRAAMVMDSMHRPTTPL